MALVTPPPFVAPNELITSAWGNANVDAITALWARHAVRLSDAAQTLTVGSTTTIAFGTELQDTDGFHAAGSASVIVPNSDLAGLYVITARFIRSAGNWSGCWVAISVNGVLYQVGPPATSIATVTICHQLNSGDTVQAVAFSNATAATVDTSLVMARMPVGA